jgi:sugar phosphate isomerase/epimerase
MMNNPIYLSTGAFTGRKNGRNHNLALEFAGQLHCDGYEFLIFEDFHDKFNNIISEYKRAGLNIPVIHAEKAIGDLLGGDEAAYRKAIELFKLNCAVGELLGSGKIVIHAWGYPASDRNPDQTIERIAEFIAAAAQYGLDLLVENIPCECGSPLAFLKRISSVYPGLHFVIDTRHAQFHGELETTLGSDIMYSVRHIHISEYSGGYKDWSRLSAAEQPGTGGIDWPMFFDRLRALRYPYSLTLEAASILEKGVDTETLNRSLDFVSRELE